MEPESNHVSPFTMTCYRIENGRLLPVGDYREAVWIDLLNPTRDIEKELETHLGIELPTREDMEEIELSSRLYQEDGALFLTAQLPAATEDVVTRMGPVTFVLANEILITVRYHDPRPFRSFPARAARSAIAGQNGETVFLGLVETIVDRLADIIERAGHTVSPVSREIFHSQGESSSVNRDYGSFLETIGRAGDLVSDIRDSITTLDRAVGFFSQHILSRPNSEAVRSRLKTVTRDLHSIGDHAGFLANKITFLLDATLGMVNIEQNGIIKIFSVAAVVFLPPTLIASIYGMNFEFMPELEWPLGYPFAVVLMILSAILPYWIFKKKRWL